ncbi:hypothetical protein TWF481_005428 [Arthrobotrys musiformis]|uniref:intramembrane prenyl-peptidase Rce1 n=1 Tax=Arthrobotrys musiformis TaxID=47236 RepID=A0AAV9WF62_9PEZI
MDIVHTLARRHPRLLAIPESHTAIVSAVLLSILFTCIYVGVLYLHPLTRPSPRQSRDAPSVIRLRIRAVYTSCLITTFSTLYALRVLGGIDFMTSLKYMGIWPVNILDIVKAVFLTMVLFAGPLAEKLWLDRDPRDDLVMDVKTSLSSWIGWRNYIVGPITEEITFRSHILALHLSVPSPNITTLIFLTPLYFGIAHLHHFYEFKLTHPDVPPHFGLLRSLIQFTYTTLFGWFAAWVYLRSGNLYAAIAIHSFCNVMGLPRFWGRLEEAWKTYVYYTILVAGAAGFYYGLFRWTESSYALIVV